MKRFLIILMTIAIDGSAAYAAAPASRRSRARTEGAKEINMAPVLKSIVQRAEATGTLPQLMPHTLAALDRLRGTKEASVSAAALYSALSRNATSPRRTVTPVGGALHAAIQKNNLEEAKALLAGGAAVDEQDAEGNTPLHCAALPKENGVAFIKLLLSAGANPLILNNEHLLPIEKSWKAVKAALYRATMEALIRDGSINSRMYFLQFSRGSWGDAVTSTDAAGETLLHYAARYNRVEFAECLIRHGASLEATNVFGDTPLHVAAFAGAVDVFVILADKTAAFVPNNAGEYPLELAGEVGCAAIADFCRMTAWVKKVEQTKAMDPADYVNNKFPTGNSLLHELLLTPTISPFINLLPAAWIELVNEHLGLPPASREALLEFDTHAENGHERVTSAFIKFAIPQEIIDAVNHRGENALCMAAVKGNVPALRALLGRMSPAAMGAKSRGTQANVLHSLARSGPTKIPNYEEVITVLLSNEIFLNATIDEPDYLGVPPLWRALERNNQWFLDKFLEHCPGKINTIARASLSPTVLHVAVSLKDTTCLKKLLASPYLDASLFFQTAPLNLTALSCAVRDKHAEAVLRLLLSPHMTPEVLKIATDSEKLTPLLCAAALKESRIVKALLSSRHMTCEVMALRDVQGRNIFHLLLNNYRFASHEEEAAVWFTLLEEALESPFCNDTMLKCKADWSTSLEWGVKNLLSGFARQHLLELIQKKLPQEADDVRDGVVEAKTRAA